MYTEMSLTIEKIARFCDFIIQKFLFIGMLLPIFLLSMANYFIYNQGAESFHLPFPVMYVFEIIFIATL